MIPYGERKGRGQTIKGQRHYWWYPPVEKTRGRKRARQVAKKEIEREQP